LPLAFQLLRRVKDVDLAKAKLESKGAHVNLDKKREHDGKKGRMMLIWEVWSRGGSEQA
jgi:hypothetical protein